MSSGRFLAPFLVGAALVAAGCGGGGDFVQTSGGSTAEAPSPGGLGVRQTPPDIFEDLPKALPPTELSPTLPQRVLLAALPASAEIPKNTFPAVMDQGQLGCCAAVAVGYEQVSYAASQGTGADVSLPANLASPAWFYKLVYLLEGYANCQANQGDDGGTWPYHYLGTAVQQGAVTLEQVPFPASNPDKSDAENLKMQCEALDALDMSSFTPTTALQIGSWAYLAQEDLTNVQDLKSYVAAGIPVGVSVNLPNNFGDYSGGVLVGNGGNTGGHAMIVVGYDDSKGAFKVQNSWGNDWGEDGYVWWSYDTFTQALSEAYVAYSTQEVSGPVTASGATLSTVQVSGDAGAPAPTGQVLQTFQTVDVQGNVNVVMEYSFDVPVGVTQVVLKGPGDWTFTWHTDRHDTRSGYYRFTRQDGSMWQSGGYEVIYHVTTSDGSTWTCSGNLQVPVLSGSDLPQAPPGPDATGPDGQTAAEQ